VGLADPNVKVGPFSRAEPYQKKKLEHSLLLTRHAEDINSHAEIIQARDP